MPTTVATAPHLSTEERQARAAAVQSEIAAATKAVPTTTSPAAPQLSTAERTSEREANASAAAAAAAASAAAAAAEAAAAAAKAATASQEKQKVEEEVARSSAASAKVREILEKRQIYLDEYNQDGTKKVDKDKKEETTPLQRLLSTPAEVSAVKEKEKERRRRRGCVSLRRTFIGTIPPAPLRSPPPRPRLPRLLLLTCLVMV